MGMVKRENPVLDHESRIENQDHHSLRLWLRLLTCTNLIEQHLRSRLRLEFSTTLARFDLMAQLDKEQNGLTMGELSKRMMVTGGNVSGIANQLEAEGLIAKISVPTDRRAFCVTLTSLGRNQFSEMAQAHESWLVEILGDLDADDFVQLMRTLKFIKSAAVTGES